MLIIKLTVPLGNYANGFFLESPQFIETAWLGEISQLGGKRKQSKLLVNVSATWGNGRGILCLSTEERVL